MTMQIAQSNASLYICGSYMWDMTDNYLKSIVSKLEFGFPNYDAQNVEAISSQAHNENNLLG